jgi:hypothetical protein
MKKLLVITCTLSILISILSCEKEPGKNNSDSPADTTGQGSLTGNYHERFNDYTWDKSTEVSIMLNGNSISSESPNVYITGNTAIINAAGNYMISGQLDNGQIKVDADNNSLVRIILNNAQIHNNSGPALHIEKSSRTLINLAEGTDNYLSDGAQYANPDEEPNAALFCRSDLTIFGGGSLTVEGNYWDAINARDGLIIKDGSYNISAIDDGIRGKDYLIMMDGNYNVTSGDEGFKSDNDLDDQVGVIVIENGNFEVVSGGDAFDAINTIEIKGGTFDITSGGGYEFTADVESSKGIKGRKKVILNLQYCTINAADHAIDSDHTIEINSGNFDIRASKAGIHSDSTVTIHNGDITISRAIEGIESHNITFNNGSLNIYSIDDSFSATAGYDVDFNDHSLIAINGGLLALETIQGDVLDSNGSIILNDGKVIIHGPPAHPEVAIDYNHLFNITGGFLVASGTNSEMTQAPSETSSQNSVLIIFNSTFDESTIFNLQDENGNNLVTFSPEGVYQSILFSSAELVLGNTYYIYTSGSSTGELNHGLYEGGEYSPGSLYTSFNLSEKVTSIRNIQP